MRMTVMMNVTLSCFFSVVAVSYFQFPSEENQDKIPQFQFESVIGWPGNLSGIGFDKNLSETNGKHDQIQTRQHRIYGLSSRLGMDGIRLCFVCLTSLIMIPVVFSDSVHSEGKHEKQIGVSFYSLLLVAESLLFLNLTSMNMILYLISFQLLILVFYLLIGLWGGKEKRRVNRKYLQFQTAGALLISFGLILATIAHSGIAFLNVPENSTLELSLPVIVQEIPDLISSNLEVAEYWQQFSPWIFYSLLIGFFITAGLFPFHTWFNTVNSETPASVAILLSVISLKIGLLGLLEIVFPLFPELLVSLRFLFITLFLIASVYTALLTLAQDDLRKMGTYLCLCQIQIIAVGIFTFNDVARYGAILMMIGHGVAFSLYFYLVSLLENRFKTREMEAFSGLSQKYSRWSFLFGITLFSLVGVPGLFGFAGNFTLLVGISQASFLYSLVVLFVFVLQGWAVFWMLQRVLFGEFREPVFIEGPSLLKNDQGLNQPDILDRKNSEQGLHSEFKKIIRFEFYFLFLLIIALVTFGIFPGTILKTIDSTNNTLKTKSEIHSTMMKEFRNPSADSPVWELVRRSEGSQL